MEDNKKKYLLMSISTELYAVPIEKVKEIIRFEKITRVRDSQHYLKGVINLRGKIIPIIDMRIKFSIEEKDYDDRTVFVIVYIDKESVTYNIGMAIDAVHEVVNIEDEEIEETPEIGFKLNREYLYGIAKIKENMAMILNLDALLTHEEVVQLKDVKSE